jgi:proteic killer suppression protein
MAIKTFKHKGLKKFFESGSKTAIQAAHANKIGRVLDRLNSAMAAKDMNAPGYDFHALKGRLAGFYSVHVNGNWTIIFQFENGDAKNVDLVDYH